MTARKDPTSAAIMRLVDKATQELDELVATMVVSLVRDLVRYAERLPHKAGALDRDRAVNAAAMVGQLSDLMDARDVQRLQAALLERMGEVMDEVVKLVPAIASAFTPNIRRKVLDAMTKAARDAARFFDHDVDRIAKRLAAAMSVGAPLDDVVADVEAMGAGIRARAHARLFTALAMASRAAVMTATDEHPDDFVFMYVGANDGVTRPFCRVHLGRVYTRDGVDRLDNGQGLPVATACGGYNCRHRWAPMLRTVAKARRYNIRN